MKKSLGARTVIFPTPVMIVGTYDKEGKANVMNAAWGGICCSEPPCVAVSLREATYTHDCILNRKAFTISIPSSDYLKECDYFGMASGRDKDKFAVTGLTHEKADSVDAPYVVEFPLVVECELVQHHKLGIHTQFVGEVKDIKAEERLIKQGGALDIELLKPVLFDPSGYGYYATGEFLATAFSIGKEIKG